MDKFCNDKLTFAKQCKILTFIVSYHHDNLFEATYELLLIIILSMNALRIIDFVILSNCRNTMAKT